MSKIVLSGQQITVLAYSEPSQITTMEFLLEIVNGFRLFVGIYYLLFHSINNLVA